MLIRVHRARIDVEVGVELLERDFEPAILEQRAERGRRQALAERTHHATGYKNIFHPRFLSIDSTRATSAGASTPTLS